MRAGLILRRHNMPAIIKTDAGLVAELVVLLGNHVVAEIGVLGFGGLELLLESGFVRGNLLLGEGCDGLDRLTELVVRGYFRRFVGVLGEVTGVADLAGTKGALSLLEVRIRMHADLALIVLHHVNGFVTCHS